MKRYGKIHVDCDLWGQGMPAYMRACRSMLHICTCLRRCMKHEKGLQKTRRVFPAPLSRTHMAPKPVSRNSQKKFRKHVWEKPNSKLKNYLRKDGKPQAYLYIYIYIYIWLYDVYIDLYVYMCMYAYKIEQNMVQSGNVVRNTMRVPS